MVIINAVSRNLFPLSYLVLMLLMCFSLEYLYIIVCVYVYTCIHIDTKIFY